MMSFNRFKSCLVLFLMAFLLPMLIFVHHKEFSKVKIPNETATQGGLYSFTYNGYEARNFSVSDNVVGSNHDSFANSSTKHSSTFTSSTPNSDKFLNGLLASGFNDEASCLSRFKSYLYHKPSPHKPSSYLIHKLRNYEHIHKLCGPHTKSYNKTMNSLKNNSRKYIEATQDMCNYIIWIPERGMGNRMVSLVSTFLYALATNRVLLVQFHNHMVGLFCEPFPNSSWLLPNDFPFINNNQIHVETYRYQSSRKNSTRDNHLLPLVVHLNIGSTNEFHQTLFHCDHSQIVLKKATMLILHSDLYFVPSLFMVPSFNKVLSKMFPNKDTVFHHLGRYLFHPSNEIWRLITRFYHAYMAKANERIGLQIRVFNFNHDDTIPHESIMNQVLRCTLKNKILPELGTQECLINSTLKTKTTMKSVLVTSLYQKHGEYLRNMYMTKPSVNGREVIGIYQPSHEEEQKFNDSLHDIKALTEIYLLSLNDVLVTSSKSTFGYVAQSLGGLKPWFLYKLPEDKNNGLLDPPCQRGSSMEPCFHGPPTIDCMGKSIDDVGKVFPFIRKCDDFSFGIKLVNDHE